MLERGPILRPLGGKTAQPRQIEKARQQPMFCPALHLVAQTAPLAWTDPDMPIGALISAPSLVQHHVGKVSVHGPFDQPSGLSISQILILRDSLTERDDAAVHCRVALVDSPTCQMGRSGARRKLALQNCSAQQGAARGRWCAVHRANGGL